MGERLSPKEVLNSPSEDGDTMKEGSQLQTEAKGYVEGKIGWGGG